ncbi:MAG: helix-turn-helix transcriptional regulator [Gammaproteobacteria bacterium]|nr:helix-turn-helix transcriptional regulator [Gammaproteobacteria bacterium]
MKTKLALGRALKEIRKARELTQEDFSVVSSRTYMSTLERGMKSPTIEKIEAIAETMKVHPLTLLAFAYVKAGNYRNADELFKKIRAELVAFS